MNHTHYSIGGMRINYTLDPKEKAQAYKTLKAVYVKKLFEYLTDDGNFNLSTPWGPDAHVDVRVNQFDKTGTTVLKKQNIKLTPINNERDRLPPTVSWDEWEFMVLEGLLRSFRSSSVRSSLDLSSDVIEKLMKTSEQTTDMVMDNPKAIKLADPRAHPFDINPNLLTDDFITTTLSFPGTDRGFKGIVSPSDYVRASTIMKTDLCAKIIGNVDMSTPFDTVTDVYGKKTLRSKANNDLELELTPLEQHHTTSEKPTKVGFLKRIISSLSKR